MPMRRAFYHGEDLTVNENGLRRCNGFFLLGGAAISTISNGSLGTGGCRRREVQGLDKEETRADSRTAIANLRRVSRGARCGTKTIVRWKTGRQNRSTRLLAQGVVP